ncbi:hypothetical protein [Pedobacter sp.]
MRKRQIGKVLYPWSTRGEIYSNFRIFHKIIFLSSVLFISCQQQKHYEKDNDIIRQSKIDLHINETAMSSVSSLNAKQKIDSAFNAWKANEVKHGRMCESLAKARVEMEKLYEEQERGENNDPSTEYVPPVEYKYDYYGDNDRFMYVKTLKTVYADFNEDGIDDGMVVFERDDCMQGAGYVGEWEKTVMFLSGKNGYTLNNRIIIDAVEKINKNALGYFMGGMVGYISFRSATSSTIGGYYYDWRKGHTSGNPSYKVNFEYNFKTKKIKFIKARE